MNESTPEPRTPRFVGLGEALFDCFDDRQVLGGAPVNFAVHSHQLLTRFGGVAYVASRVGNDDLGRQFFNAIGDRGIPADYVQVDASHSTGRVLVQLDSHGQPEYEIQEDVAWDYIESEPSLHDLMKTCDGLCFGTLAQRSPRSHDTIQACLGLATQAIRLLDVNLRGQYYAKDVIVQSVQAATVVKLNEEELPVVCKMLELADSTTSNTDKRAFSLLSTYQLDLVALTRGDRGTVLYVDEQRIEGDRVRYARSADADSVGAGDACCAGLMFGLHQRWPRQQTLALADHLGAYVASRPGGTPRLPDDILKAVAAGSVCDLPARTCAS